jgi:hypothetical protein
MLTTTKPNTATATQRVLMAPFKNIWIAMPMSLSRKIIRLSDLLAAGQSLKQEIQIDHWTAQIFDLHEYVYGKPAQQGDSHLVVLELSDGKVLGIPMSQLPTITNLETSTLKPIPSNYRDLYNLEIASHISIMPQGQSTEATIFLVDGEKFAAFAQAYFAA